MKPKIIFLAGPTASGKTDTALCLAKKLNAEIISCDSMQVYQDLDILTSKPSAAARKKIPHYLIDCVSLSKEYNVSQYRREAVRKAAEIIKRGKVPLFVGGTGLYMSVVIDGIFSGGKESPELRQRLLLQAEKRGSRFLHRQLKKVDPVSAERIHPHDARRIIRALEVYKTTGRPISELQKQRKGLGDTYDVRVFCLCLDREELYERINCRVDRMVKRGAVQEVKRLLKRKLSRTAGKAIGLREIGDYLSGAITLEQAKEEMKRNTRMYAKRQLTWFRKDKRICWIDISGNTPMEAAEKIWRECSW